MKIHKLDADGEYIFIFRGTTMLDAQHIEQKLNRWLKEVGKDPLVGVVLTKGAEFVAIVEMQGIPKATHISQHRSADIEPPSNGPFLYGPYCGFHNNTIAHRDADGTVTARSAPILCGNKGDASQIKDFILWLNSRKTVFKQ